MVVLFLGELVPRSIYYMMILTDDCVTAIVSFFGKKSKVHIKSFIYSTRKAFLKVFLERAVVELVYKFDEKSTANLKR